MKSNWGFPIRLSLTDKAYAGLNFSSSQSEDLTELEKTLAYEHAVTAGLQNPTSAFQLTYNYAIEKTIDADSSSIGTQKAGALACMFGAPKGLRFGFQISYAALKTISSKKTETNFTNKALSLTVTHAN